MSKKVLILGGNQETAMVVQYAISLGYYIIVVDPNPQSIAKKFAYESFEIDGFDVDRIVRLAIEKNIDGVLVGVADILVKPYYEICRKLKLPCYANELTSKYLTNKKDFRLLCEDNGIDVIPYFHLADLNKISDKDLPILLKPVDNGAGVGIDICFDIKDIDEKISKAKTFSKTGEIVIEKYMNAEDLFAYYTIINGTAHLSAIADRITKKITKDTSPVCILAKYPSKHIDQFIKQTNELVKKMTQTIDLKNGILNIQFFKENDKFYAYDPGFRIQGEGMHLHLLNANNIDHRGMLFNFATEGRMIDSDFIKKNDPKFRGKKHYTIWILLKIGKIKEISGLEKIKSNDEVFDIIQRFKVGDQITNSMMGTERQVFARIYVSVFDIKEMLVFINTLKDTLVVNDEFGNSMIIDFYKDILEEVSKID